VGGSGGIRFGDGGSGGDAEGDGSEGDWWFGVRFGGGDVDWGLCLREEHFH